MGIVVCVAMLFGLVILRPSPFNAKQRVNFNAEFKRVVCLALAVLGIWNALYGLLKISGFWCFMSIVSGLAMVLAAGLIAIDQSEQMEARSKVGSSIILVLALSFLVYAVTLIQLNLGYGILR